MNALTNPTRISTRARVLEAVRWYFRACGMSPSLSEIAARAGIPKQRVGRYLDELQRDGHLSYVKFQRRSIALTDPSANLSDEQLCAACVGRGWIDPILAQSGESHPIDMVLPQRIIDELSKSVTI